jgi:hypothetical protein
MPRDVFGKFEPPLGKIVEEYAVKTELAGSFFKIFLL